ncbi:MAG: hypothetical protein R3C28_26150 [Pirellulaceae bacterium]
MVKAVLGQDQGFPGASPSRLSHPRTADYRASVHDIADYLLTLMNDRALRQKMGEAGRNRVVERFDYFNARRRREILRNIGPHDHGTLLRLPECSTIKRSAEHTDMTDQEVATVEAAVARAVVHHKLTGRDRASANPPVVGLSRNSLHVT